MSTQDTKETVQVTPEQSSRRKFLKGSAVGATAAVAAVPYLAQAQTVLKVQAAWGGGIFLEFAQDYVDKVNKMSGGSLKIDMLSVNSVVKTAEMQTAVHKGVLDGAHLVTAYWYSKSAAASLFGTGPCFGWNANQLLGWMKYGGGRELYYELMDALQLDIVGFFNSPMPAQPLGWFVDPITSADQLKGLKYRTVGLAADVCQEMGLSVVQLPGGEIQPAMKSGLIDAAEFNNPTSDKDFGMQDVAKNYHLASFHQSQETFEIIFNRTLFNKLSPEHQSILEFASEAASSDFTWKYQDRYSNDLIALEEDFGVNVQRTDDSIMQVQLEAWDVVVERLANEDPFFAKVVESQKAWSKRVVRYELLNAPNYQGAYEHYFGSL